MQCDVSWIRSNSNGANASFSTFFCLFLRVNEPCNIVPTTLSNGWDFREKMDSKKKNRIFRTFAILVTQKLRSTENNCFAESNSSSLNVIHYNSNCCIDYSWNRLQTSEKHCYVTLTKGHILVCTFNEANKMSAAHTFQLKTDHSTTWAELSWNRRNRTFWTFAFLSVLERKWDM